MTDGTTDRAKKSWLSARQRKILGAATLVFGVWFVARSVAPVAPRDAELRVRLGAFRDPPTRASAITVSFDQRGENTVRSFHTRFGADGPPLVWSRPISIPEGDYSATVLVEAGGHVVSRTTHVHVNRDQPVEVPAPASE